MAAGVLRGDGGATRSKRRADSGGARVIEPSTTRRKMVALVLSGIFPGLGQFYNRQPLKGTGSWWLARY